MAEFDIAAFASLTTEKMTRIEKAIRDGDRPKGFHLTKIATGTPDSANRVILDLGHPPVNSEWSVDLVTVVGSDVFTVIANTNCALFVGDPANFSAADCVVPSNANTVPNTVNPPKGTVWVHSEERLFVVVYNVTVATQVITANAKVTQYLFGDVEPHSSNQ